MSKKLVVTNQVFGSTDGEEELARSLGVALSSHQCTDAETFAATAGADVVLVKPRAHHGCCAGRFGQRGHGGPLRHRLRQRHAEAAQRHGVAVANVPEPHAAFFSDDSIVALQRVATEEAARALAGEPLMSRVA